MSMLASHAAGCGLGRIISGSIGTVFRRRFTGESDEGFGGGMYNKIRKLNSCSIDPNKCINGNIGRYKTRKAFQNSVTELSIELAT